MSTSVPTPPPAAPKAGAPKRPSLIGQVAMMALYHKGAVIQNAAGETLLLKDAWTDAGRPKSRFGGQGVMVVSCSADGEAKPDAKPLLLDRRPATALSTGTPKAPWEGIVTLLRSALPWMPSGIKSDDPSLALVPYGPLYGRCLGTLSAADLAALAAEAKNEGFKKVALAAKTFAAFGPRPAKAPATKRLSDGGMKLLLRAQATVIRSVPLVNVMEHFLGYAPEEIIGDKRKYRINDDFINLDAKRNSFGSLNDYQFRCLAKPRGSSNNAMDLVAGVREMEGVGVDFRAIREALIRHYNLQSQLDAMYDDAVKQEQEAKKAGKSLEHIEADAAKVEGELKAATKPSSGPDNEPEVQFDLAKGDAGDRGGGFLEREDLWPKAREYLVGDRKLDPALVDYLYASRNLYAAQRVFAGDGKFSRVFRQDIIVAPVFGFETKKIVGVDTKPLPTKPGEKTEGRNHGKTSKGAFMFGNFGPGMKRLVLCEGFIKSVAFLQLHRESLRLGEESCIMARSGANPTLNIIPKLKELNAEAIAAFDNDFVGRFKSRAFADECKKQGVPCREVFVEPSEVTLYIDEKETKGFHDKSRIDRIEAELKQWASENKVPICEERELPKPGTKAFRLPNTEAVIFRVEEFLKDDRRISSRDYQERAKGLSEKQAADLEKRRWLKLSIHSKDWDDVTRKGVYQPRLPDWLGLAAKPEATPPGVRGLLICRSAKDGVGIIYSVGVAGKIYDVALDPESAPKLAPYLGGEFPREVEFAASPTPSLLRLPKQDGNMAEVSPILGRDLKLQPSPENVQRSWRETKNPLIQEAIRRLAGILPAPGEAKPSGQAPALSR